MIRAALIGDVIGSLLAGAVVGFVGFRLGARWERRKAEQDRALTYGRRSIP